MSTLSDHVSAISQPDHFDDRCCDISVIGDEMTTMTKTSEGEWSSIYGCEWIKLNNTESITQYNIKINKLQNELDGLMFIGISSNTIHCNGRYSFYNDNKNFSYRSDGIIYHNSKYFDAIENGQYKTNDIIKLTINPFTAQISFHKNNKLMCCQEYNASSTKCYKLAISLFNKYDSVSIINQCNQSPATTPPKLTKQTTVDDILTELIENNNELTTQLQLLKQELYLIKQSNRELTFENDSLKKQNKSLRNTTEVFNEANYLNWNVSQTVSWVMSISNGKYLKYYEMLNIKMRDCELNGSKLNDLDYVDIKQQLGIIDIDDRKILYRNIQLLIAKNKKNKKTIIFQGEIL